LKKNIIKKENTKETGKKPCKEKLYQSIVFVRKNLYLLVIAILNQFNIKKNKINKDNFREKHNKNRKKTMWKKTL